MRARSPRTGVVAFLLGTLIIALAPSAVAQPAPPPDLPHVQGDETVPVYDYADAIRESVDVESTLDSDNDGAPDTVRVDIIRPREADEAGDDVPVIMVASPYYQCCGRGNEGEFKVYGPDGVPISFPLYYDNYFVPRGYAVAFVDLMGTANSLGCMDVGGLAEVGSATAAIDWLNGNATATDLDGVSAVADWTDGQVGMIGKSWDGSVANGAAATGVEGLETIVPIAAISSWYEYMRQNGTLQSRGYWNFLHGYVNERPSSACADLRAEAIPAADDATGNYNDFWAERDYVKDADQVDASVFVIHGVGDGNVDMLNVGPWWEALEANDVPRKIWLTQTGHVEPFDFRRAEFVDTLHDWFDFWLQDLDNGIMDEPMSSVELEPNEWTDEATWPARGSRTKKLYLSGPAETGEGSMSPANNAAGTESVRAGGGRLLGWSTSELNHDVRLSGTPYVNLRMKLDRPTAEMRMTMWETGDVLEVDDSIDTLGTESCWGASTADDDACYLDTALDVDPSDERLLTFGDGDAAHWQGIETLSPLEPEQWVTLRFPINTTDVLLHEGNRLAVELRVGTAQISLPSSGATATIDYSQSWVELPVAGNFSGLAPHGPRPALDLPEQDEPTVGQLLREFR
ncbi:CocE/NonD family hydrolase [Salsipaludibacter albus]|uniref:CocE/NonD family hydrolase n=1 Tax=Salsipaludibacter albus TaxID=2849650 RepID=UPI001EE4B5A4|nr:CocE/NonD family hydrolase [Salsipaludibacter albus]MBY5164381.1 Xaa-Pro dipeptidyl-peptidase [Salsipaludibacter albus]